MLIREFVKKWAPHLNERDCNLLIFQKITNNWDYYLIDEVKLKEIQEEVKKDLDALDLSGINPQDFFEETLKNFDVMGTGFLGEYYTPPTLKSFILEIAKCYEDFGKWRSVYDPTCGCGGLLASVPDKDQYIGNEIRREVSCLADMYIKLQHPDKEVKIYCSDALKMDLEEKVDLIVANPPFGLHWKPEEKDERLSFGGHHAPNKAAEFAFMKHMLNNVKDSGLVLTLSYPGILYREKSEKEIRKYLLEKNWIEAIIYLPERLFTFTSIEVVLVVFKKNKEYEDILLMDLRHCGIKGKQTHVLKSEAITEALDIYRAYLKGEPLPKETWERYEKQKPQAVVVNPEIVAEKGYGLTFDSYKTWVENPGNKWIPEKHEDALLAYDIKTMYYTIQIQKTLTELTGWLWPLRKKFLEELAPHIEGFYEKYKEEIKEARKNAWGKDKKEEE